MKKFIIFILFLLWGSNNINAQKVDFCLKLEREGLPFHKCILKTKFLQNTFNDIHDSSDYFRYNSIDSILIFRNDSLPASRVWGDTILNSGEQIILIHYCNDSAAQLAFNDLISYIKNPNLMLLLFIKSGLVLGINKNIIAVYQPNDNPFVRQKISLKEICRKFYRLGYHEIHFHDINLERY